MHTCPDCGQACYCGGDVDDCPSEEPDFCAHSCDGDGLPGDERYEDDDPAPTHSPTVRP